jgi:transcriptional regulator with XRE-family HTH domain
VGVDVSASFKQTEAKAGMRGTYRPVDGSVALKARTMSGVGRFELNISGADDVVHSCCPPGSGLSLFIHAKQCLMAMNTECQPPKRSDKAKIRVARRGATARGATSGRVPLMGLKALGGRVRVARSGQGITLRELARRVGVSPSLISQIERGLVAPSVGTLWSITTELGLVMDELFGDAEPPAISPEPRKEFSSQQEYVQRKTNRKCVRLAGGVEWQRLTAQPDDEVEFLHVTYEVNAESSPERSLFRHGGKEYAYVLAGRLGVQIGFERYELGPGDSVSFNSQLPHRLWTIGDKSAVAIWAVVHRTHDRRLEVSGEISPGKKPDLVRSNRSGRKPR